MKNPDHKNIADSYNNFNRRQFLKMAGITAIGLPFTGFTDFKVQGVSIIIDPADSVSMSVAVRWATKELEMALKAQGIAVQRCSVINKAKSGNLCVPVVGLNSILGKRLLKISKTTIPSMPESLGLIPVNYGVRPVLMAVGYDERGLTYAILELADRVNYSSSPVSAMHISKPIIEQPANKVRGLNRLFVSEIEDKPWFNDRDMWPQYLTMLATQRFNRFNLSMGIGYDFLQNVTDAYFLFAYPFLLSVPGYNVHVPQLADTERENNLKMLQFISEQTVERGMEFRLGIWMHGYEWLKSPNPNYTIQGLTKETHAAYCRDALSMLLKTCPSISGITFRVHGESGVNEGSYDFWKTVFDGIRTCGRTVDIDMHSKGIDQSMLDTALSVGVPVSVSPKFWAEHMGMPYHQADIRELEIPKPNKKTSGLMNLSEGSRSFMRYGYGDLLKEDRKYDVVYRIWPGSQRLLLWGDPVTGAAQSRIFSFCGSAGVELMEPLSFKGRRGSGIEGDRCGYKDITLKPRWDWEKYLYSLRVFGRTLYNPDTGPDVWQRYLRKQFSNGAGGMQQALAHATRILPTVLTAHAASAGNNNYWPEMYTNMSLIAPEAKSPYGDTPSPKVFGTVSPLDPQLFLSINNFAKELLNDKYSGKYTPLEVAQWLHDDADTADKGLQQANVQSANKTKPEFRRMFIDVSMQIGLGRFFAAKFRSGVFYAVYEQSGDYAALEASLKNYKQARTHWAKLANMAKDVYKKDVTAGELTWLRGHWLDRLPAIDEDIALMNKKLDEAKPGAARPVNIVTAVNECLNKPERAVAACYHNPPKKFIPGNPVNLELGFDQRPVFARLHYRHVNQGERYETIEMKADGNHYQATIPEKYTQSPYPLAYYFELMENSKKVTLYPGFGANRFNQPYFVIRQHMG